MEKITPNIRVYDNFLELSLEDGFEDNCQYEIHLINIKDINGDICNKTFTLTTKLSPLFSDINAVKSLIEEDSISDYIILYHIREASRYAEYIKGEKIDEDNIPFEVNQFVKYKAAHECLLNFSIKNSSSPGLSGTVGDVTFNDKETNRDITGLLTTFENEIQKWMDAIKGYHLEGRAAPDYAVRGSWRDKFDYPDPSYSSPRIDSFCRGVRSRNEQ